MRDTLCGKTDFRRVRWLENVTQTNLCEPAHARCLRNRGGATRPQRFI